MKNITILSIGGAGFLGRNLTEQFIKNGAKVIVLDCEMPEYDQCFEINFGLTYLKGNYNDKSVVKDIFEKFSIDIVLCLASSLLPGTSLNTVVDDMNTNLTSVMNLLEIMKVHSVNKFIYFSTGGAIYGRNGKEICREDDPTCPINSYGWIKLTVEKFLQLYSYQYGMQYLIIRPSNPFGKYQNIFGLQGLIAVTFGKLIQNKCVEIWGDGTIIRDYLYVEDLCKAVISLLIMDKWNEIYNIGSGKGRSTNDILSIIRKVTEIQFDINYQPARSVDINVNILDVSKLKNSIGWDSIVDIEKGIIHFWTWINKNRNLIK